MAGRGIRLVHVSSLAAMGPSCAGMPLTEDAEPHPLTHYGKSKLEAERLVRDLAPDAVIVRPPVVYGPRDTDVFQLLKSISKGLVLEISGGERWFSAIYVKDLVKGLLAALGTPCAAGRSYFLAHAKPLSWGQLGASAARIMHRTPRVVAVPFEVANAVGACAEIWARMTGKPGIISREKIAEARCMAWTRDGGATQELLCSAHTSTKGIGGDPGVVQGGGLADVLKTDTRFWAVDKIILAYFGFAVVLIVGWWSKLPDALPLLAANVLVGASIVYQVAAQPDFVDLPQLVSAALRGLLLQRDGALYPGDTEYGCRPIPGGSGLPDLGRSSIGLAGAGAHAGADRISANCLHAFCPGSALRRVGPVALGAAGNYGDIS